MQIFDLVYYLTKFGIHQGHKVAFVTQQVARELRIEEEMIHNALSDGRTFADVEAAKAWLLG